MAKFHVNDKGEAGQCSAGEGNCPFADDSEHYDSKAEAAHAYENKMNAQALPKTVSKPAAPLREIFMLVTGDKHGGEHQYYGDFTALREDVVSLATNGKLVKKLEKAKDLNELKTIVDENEESFVGNPGIGRELAPTTSEGITYSLVVAEDSTASFYSFEEMQKYLSDELEDRPALQAELAKATTFEELEDFSFEAGWNSWGHIEKVKI